MTAAQSLRAEAAKRILIKDGPYGTAIQAEKLPAAAYCAGLDLRPVSAVLDQDAFGSFGAEGVGGTHDLGRTPSK